MSEDDVKLLVARMCKQTSQLAQMIGDVRGDIAVLSQFIIEASRLPESEKQAMQEKLKKMREKMGDRLSEFPPPDPPFGE